MALHVSMGWGFSCKKGRINMLEHNCQCIHDPWAKKGNFELIQNLDCLIVLVHLMELLCTYRLGFNLERESMETRLKNGQNLISSPHYDSTPNVYT
jgi:hypothetical protein